MLLLRPLVLAVRRERGSASPDCHSPSTQLCVFSFNCVWVVLLEFTCASSVSSTLSHPSSHRSKILFLSELLPSIGSISSLLVPVFIPARPQTQYTAVSPALVLPRNFRRLVVPWESSAQPWASGASRLPISQPRSTRYQPSVNAQRYDIHILIRLLRPADLPLPLVPCALAGRSSPRRWLDPTVRSVTSRISGHDRRQDRQPAPSRAV
ncbi:hypothetical protein VTJ04DRAFT_4618 [Mycothermus thermophilus]|uniref:uncharacterized protein n=1 Tax=Humicola insolens TaxID=85995 RepID=UPI0037422B2C